MAIVSGRVEALADVDARGSGGTSKTNFHPFRLVFVPQVGPSIVQKVTYGKDHHLQVVQVGCEDVPTDSFLVVRRHQGNLIRDDQKPSRACLFFFRQGPCFYSQEFGTLILGEKNQVTSTSALGTRGGPSPLELSSRNEPPFG